ncbi:MAG: serine hydrolase [Caldilineaceae bacterium]|nr:serine hydrolase [Caldilineaceae bacterium]
MTLERTTALVRTSPEAQGISSSAILTFVDVADRTLRHLHSFMLLRHGAVIAEGWWSPYAPQYPHVLFSLSKSFASTAVGLAVAEGRLSVDDRVIDFFLDETPAEISDNLAAMRIHHLLSMNTGHAEDVTGALWERKDGNWAAAFLAQPVAHQPGTYFVYNSAATYMLSAIVQKLTGQTLIEYLTPRLFRPLGIENPFWESCPRGINVGGWGLNITTEDIARFGQLYLQRGEWHGQQLVPAAWVDEATSAHSDNSRNENPDWAQGYGYQFWRCRHNAYRGDGAFGQFCVVLPEHDAVIAITAGIGNMQSVLDLVWEHLLPAFRAETLPENPAAADALRGKLGSLALPTLSGDASSPLAPRVSGKVYQIDANEAKIETISLDFGADETIFTMRNELGEHRVACGYGTLRHGVTEMNGRGRQRVAASGAWTADDLYSMRLYFYETPFYLSIDCRFEDDRISVRFERNVDFGPTERPLLTGKQK